MRGEIVAQSDVEGIPDLAGEGGLVAAVPATRGADLWAAAGAVPAAGQESYAQFVLDREGFERLAATVAEVDDDGRFELDADPGDYLLCRVVPTFAGDLAGVRGCAPVRLPRDGTLRLTTGEAGFRVSPDAG